MHVYRDHTGLSHRLFKLLSYLCVLFLLPTQAVWAHVLQHGPHHTLGFMQGWMHPFSGLEHLLATLAISLWAAHIQPNHRIEWLPVIYIGMLGLGLFIGTQAIHLPAQHWSLLLPPLVTGLLIAKAKQLPLALTALIVSIFAVYHGHIHTEAAQATTLIQPTYHVGMLLATSLLLIAGIIAGRVLFQRPEASTTRFYGLALAGAGCLVWMT